MRSGSHSAARFIALALTLVVGATGCSPESGQDVGATELGAQAEEAAPYNVVWLVLDALSAREVALLGGPRPNSPHLERLAAEALVFERAYAQAPYTVASTASFLTGRYPTRTTERRHLVAPIAERLGSAGFRTAAFTENPMLTEHLFSAGFDQWQTFITPEGMLLGSRNSEATIDTAVRWMTSQAGSPFFAYLHLLPPHAPYSPPPPFMGRFSEPLGVADPDPATAIGYLVVSLGLRTPGKEDLRAFLNAAKGKARPTETDRLLVRTRYHEHVAYADALAGRLFDTLRELDLLDRTILVVTSDHGEAFGDNGFLVHASSLYDDQIHVPLLVRAPASTGLGTGRIESPVELVDVVPTLLELLGMSRDPAASGASDQLDGRSLVGLSGSDASPEDAFARAFFGPAQAVIEERWKLVVSEDATRLHDLVEDPLERSDVAPDRADVTARLLARLEAPHPSIGAPPAEPDGSAGEYEVAPSIRAELEALGYSEHAMDPPEP